MFASKNYPRAIHIMTNFCSPALPDSPPTKVVKPLEGLLVLDFSQFLAGPMTALKLGDLGARVIKIERPGKGDLCRQLYISNLELDGDSTLFHSINRNKESYAANLKDPDDLAAIRKLIERADVLIENFRPGIMKRLGLGPAEVEKINPRLVYASITGYGNEGPWVGRPGQDLLAQSLSGLVWLNGDAGQPPTPFGLAVADMMAGNHCVQGILACLLRRGITGLGGLVETSLMESTLDFQFEVLTTHLNDGGELPRRCRANNAHAYLGAPYGIYQTADSYIAIAMGSVLRFGELIECARLAEYSDPETWFTQRDEIKQIIADHLRTQPTAHWLSRLEPADYWCSPILTWPELMESEAFRALDMVQVVHRGNGAAPLRTTCCPIRIDGQRLKAARHAPKVGEQTAEIREEYDL